MAEFNPDEHTVAETVDYLETVDPAEFARVLDAERAGKARQGILTASQEDGGTETGDGYTLRVVDAYKPGEPIKREKPRVTL